MASQSTGATTAVGEILGEAFDRGAGDGGFVERRGIAADDVRYCGAAGGEVAGLKRGGDIGDVPVQAALRDQGAGDQRRRRKCRTASATGRAG